MNRAGQTYLIPATGMAFLVVGAATEPYFQGAWAVVFLEDPEGRLWYFSEDRLRQLDRLGIARLG